MAEARSSGCQTTMKIKMITMIMAEFPNTWLHARPRTKYFICIN